MTCYYLKLSQTYTVHLHRQQHSFQEVLQIHHIFLWVNTLRLRHQNQPSVNDCPQLISSVTCSLLATVCSLLLCPLFIDCFCVFHSLCLLLSQLYSQYFTFSTSSCPCSQSTLNTVTQL